MNLAERLKKIRTDAGLKQAAFGEAVGLSQKAVSQYESGRYQPGKARLFVVAEKFNVNTEWLIDGEGEPYKTQTINSLSKKKIEDAYIRELFQALPVEMQRRVIEALREIIPCQDTSSNVGANIGTVNGNVSINQGLK